MDVQISIRKRYLAILILSILTGVLLGCTATTPEQPGLTPTIAVYSSTPLAKDHDETLLPNEIAALESLTIIDHYPLYTMHINGSYQPPEILSQQPTSPTGRTPPTANWACSLFSAFGDPEAALYGRNFDWQPSPAVLLFTDPADGYASVSMVDIEYLGFSGEGAQNITYLPISERQALLDAPQIPFDGMNEHGLVVGMAAVPGGNMQPDPGKATIGSLGVIRLILDHAKTIDEALAIFRRYNIRFSEVPIHYLLAAQGGQAVLVEFYRGEMVVTPNETPWHLATNFLRAAHPDSPSGICQRYDAIHQKLSQSGGRLDTDQALELLAQVAQGNTQWSIVYGMIDGRVDVVMGRRFEQPYTFSLLDNRP